MAKGLSRAIDWHVRSVIGRLPNLRNRAFFALDLLLLPASVVAAFLARYEGMAWTTEVSDAMKVFLVVSVPVKMIVLLSLGMYRRL